MALHTNCLADLLPPLDLWMRREVEELRLGEFRRVNARCYRMPVNPADVPRPAGDTTESGPRPAARAAQGIRAHENASEGSGLVELAPNKRLHPSDRT